MSVLHAEKARAITQMIRKQNAVYTYLQEVIRQTAIHIEGHFALK
jgi:hypothetical protein